MMNDVVVSDGKQKLIDHPLYQQMKSLKDIHTFMESHVFAVWDFMSLLKTLQNQLTCTQIPWIPSGSASTRFFINEIVLGEESDKDQNGNHISHFELYLKAMEEVGASTECVRNFIHLLQQGATIKNALISCKAPKEAVEFVSFTFEKIEQASTHELAALFTYGREDLIPGMFISMVESLHLEHQNLSTFLYYLNRHIEIDGDHHGQLASQMTRELIGEDNKKQEEVDAITEAGYQQRVALWDGILSRICS